MSALLFTGFLALQNPTGIVMDDKEAPRYLLKAVAYEYNLQEIGKKYEKKYTPEWLRKNAVYFGITYQLVLEKRVGYTWKF